jgi:hypothetical protein
LREVPVVEGHVGVDARLQESVDDAVVVVQALLVHPAGAVRQDARPAQRQPVGVQAELLHQGDVVAIPVVGVARHVARDVLEHLPRCVPKGVPDRRPLPVLVPPSLDLERTGGDAELESGREDQFIHRHRWVPS